MGDYYPFGMEHYGHGWTYIGPQHQYTFQGQEKHEDFGLNWSQFNWRNHMPDLGRFFNVDPLSEEYSHNSTYAFSENRLLDAIELEGLEAWSINRDWNERDDASFAEFASERIVSMQKEECVVDCADFAVQLIIEYAADNNLAISFTDAEGNRIDFNDESNKGIGEAEYLQKVKGSTSAESINNDMVNIDVTQSLTPKPGNMTNDDTHINVVRSLEEDENARVERIPTASGTYPARVPTNSTVSFNRTFKEWKTIKRGRELNHNKKRKNGNYPSSRPNKKNEPWGFY